MVSGFKLVGVNIGDTLLKVKKYFARSGFLFLKLNQIWQSA